MYNLLFCMQNSVSIKVRVIHCIIWISLPLLFCLLHLSIIEEKYVKKSPCVMVDLLISWYSSVHFCLKYFEAWMDGWVDMAFFFLSCTLACRISVPWPGIEPSPHQWKHQILTTRELPRQPFRSALLILSCWYSRPCVILSPLSEGWTLWLQNF